MLLWTLTVQTARLVMGGDAGETRSGYHRSCRRIGVNVSGDGSFLLRRLCPREAGEGFHSIEGPLASSMSSTTETEPGSKTQEGTIHLLGLCCMIGPETVTAGFDPIRAGTVVQPLKSV
jgi:hypothetical protein